MPQSTWTAHRHPTFGLVSTIALVLMLPLGVAGHGRLVEPPGRSTMWRFGFDNPENYDDMGLFCGGASVQWGQNGGKCGVCGDSFTGPWENEPGGKYANGIIVRKYQVGETIKIGVHITANHKGWFEFRLCQNDDPALRVGQECFDKNLLADVTGTTRFPIKIGMEMVKYSLKLPGGVACKDCVLQWKYNTGNSWGKDSVTKESCIGCGPQEQFYGCADVAIGDNDDVTMGDTDKDVVVPNGDVDERKWEEMPDPCACHCGQTGTAASVGLSLGLASLVTAIVTSIVFMVSSKHT